MKRKTIPPLLLLLASTTMSHGISLLSPDDAIIAVNSNSTAPIPNYPPAEAPRFAIDGTLAKYLNFGGAGTGFITTPTTPAAVQSFTITTANDASGRDPTSYEIYGTNDAITSPEGGNGSGESWTLVSSGQLSLPSGRGTVGDLVSFSNPTAYSSYKVVFPTVGGEPLMQISEFTSFATSDGTGSRVFETGNPIIAIDSLFVVASRSSSPANQSQDPTYLLDSDPLTKYLNFGRDGSGFIVTPEAGSSIVKSFTLTSAGDAAGFVGRNPASYEIYGTNQPILSLNHSYGTAESWTLITAGGLDATQMPVTNLTTGVPVEFSNETAYTSYKVLFPTLNGTNNPNSMQLADFQFDAVPEPSVAMLGAVAMLGLLRRRR